RAAWSGLPRLRLEHLQECLGERGPVLSGECDDLARERRAQAADLGAQSVWHDVLGDDRDAESGGGQVGGGGHLACLDGPARGEPGPRAHSENEFRQAVIRAEEDPVAFGEFVERHGALTPRQRVRCREHDDELLPAKVDDGTSPLWWAGPYGDVADADAHGLIERPAV